MEPKKPVIKQEETSCKVQKIDPKVWKLELTGSSDSLFAEINLKDKRFGIEYKNQALETLNVSFDKGSNVLNLEYKNKGVKDFREISVKIPFNTPQVSVQTREVYEVSEIPEKKIEQVPKQISKKDFYLSEKAEKYVSKIVSNLNEQNVISESSLFEIFPTKAERIGLKACLRHLEREGLIEVTSNEIDTYYKFLKNPQKLEKSEEKRISKSEYLKILEGLMKDNKIAESDIDSVFKTGNERKGIKRYIHCNYVAKGLAQKIEDPSGAIYMFPNPEILKKHS